MYSYICSVEVCIIMCCLLDRSMHMNVNLMLLESNEYVTLHVLLFYVIFV